MRARTMIVLAALLQGLAATEQYECMRDILMEEAVMDALLSMDPAACTNVKVSLQDVRREHIMTYTIRQDTHTSYNNFVLDNIELSLDGVTESRLSADKLVLKNLKTIDLGTEHLGSGGFEKYETRMVKVRVGKSKLNRRDDWDLQETRTTQVLEKGQKIFDRLDPNAKPTVPDKGLSLGQKPSQPVVQSPVPRSSVTSPAKETLNKTPDEGKKPVAQPPTKTPEDIKTPFVEEKKPEVAHQPTKQPEPEAEKQPATADDKSTTPTPSPLETADVSNKDAPSTEPEEKESPEVNLNKNSESEEHERPLGTDESLPKDEAVPQKDQIPVKENNQGPSISPSEKEKDGSQKEPQQKDEDQKPPQGQDEGQKQPQKEDVMPLGNLPPSEQQVEMPEHDQNALPQRLDLSRYMEIEIFPKPVLDIHTDPADLPFESDGEEVENIEPTPLTEPELFRDPLVVLEKKPAEAQAVKQPAAPEPARKPEERPKQALKTTGAPAAPVERPAVKSPVVINNYSAIRFGEHGKTIFSLQHVNQRRLASSVFTEEQIVSRVLHIFSLLPTCVKAALRSCTGNPEAQLKKYEELFKKRFGLSEIIYRLKCGSNENFFAGACYAKCPPDFEDLRLFCRKPGYRRRSVKMMDERIDPGFEDYEPNLEVERCPEHFEPAGPALCRPLCPLGWRDLGQLCRKPARYRHQKLYIQPDRPLNLSS